MILIFLFLSSFLNANSQQKEVDKQKIREDLHKMLNDLSQNYIYLQEKNVGLECIREYYEKKIDLLKTKNEAILFFEYLLDEFYDNHLTLNTNIKSSYRLFAPIYASYQNGKLIISNVWQTQIENFDQKIIAAEIKKINGIKIGQAINNFPTYCNDKDAKKVKEWIGNKLLAGRYDQPRVLTLKLVNGKVIELDLDKIKLKNNKKLLTTKTVNGIGYIRIENSLGINNLITEFDKSLNKLMNAKGLIIDLRNTVDGGNTYVARGIMGRFIKGAKAYQKHATTEKYGNNPAIEREWIEYVSPRLEQYKNPVVILVGRWTGSMGEGLAIGFDGLERAKIVGSKMARLAGEINGFSFKHQNYGYRIPTTKLFHINGTPREKYVPSYYVKQTTVKKDETLEKGIEIINRMID